MLNSLTETKKFPTIGMAKMNLKNKVLVLLMLFVCNANMAYAVQDFFAEANQRIEQHRKTDITVLVLDSNGQPVPNAQVEVEMQRHAFRWGTAVVADLINSNSSINSIYRQKILENFNAVVFENDLKWPAWEGAWGPYLGWSQAEQALDWCDANNLPSRGHYLAWATLSGIDGYGPGNPSNDPAQIQGPLLDHIQDKLDTVGTRITEWDVINHPIGWGPTTYEDLFGDAYYSSIVEFARSMAPVGTELWMNEDSILNGGPVANQYEQVLLNLEAFAAQPDGIGFQDHFKSSWGRNLPDSHERMYTQMERFSGLVDRLQVTEFDIDVGEFDNEGNLTNYDQQHHAELMTNYLISLFSHPRLEGVTMWGFWEGAHWLPTAALYNQDWTERPALQAYRDLVFGDWWTMENGPTGSDGEYDVRGFKGDYLVRVTHDGTEYLQTAQFNSDSGQVEVVVPATGLIGDVNMDGQINLLDVQPFIDLLSSGEYQFEADTNQNGVVNLLDVGLFVELLSGS